MKQELLTAGEFAKLACTTKRTVQYYDKLGILEPFKIADNGYRYYKQNQILDFQVILLLRALKFPLRNIKEYLKKGKSLQDLFDAKRSSVVDEIKYLKYTLKSLHKYFKNLKSNGTMIRPKVKQVKPLSYYYINKTGPYSRIGKFCAELVSMFEKRPKGASTLTVFEEKGYRPKKSKMKIGILCKRGLVLRSEYKKIVKKGKLPFFKALTYMHNGSGSTLSLFWKELERYAKLRGYKRDFDVPGLIDLEIYWKVSDKDYNQFFEIFLPIL